MTFKLIKIAFDAEFQIKPGFNIKSVQVNPSFYKVVTINIIDDLLGFILNKKTLQSVSFL